MTKSKEPQRTQVALTYLIDGKERKFIGPSYEDAEVKAKAAFAAQRHKDTVRPYLDERYPLRADDRGSAITRARAENILTDYEAYLELNGA